MRLFRRQQLPTPTPDVSVQRDFAPAVDWKPSEEDFRQVADSSEVVEGSSITVEIRQAGVVVTRFEGRVVAFLDVCPHWGSSFLDDPIEGDHVRCPWHRWCWSLRTGDLVSPTRSSQFPLRWVPARERAGKVEIAVPPDVHATDREARKNVGH